MAQIKAAAPPTIPTTFANLFMGPKGTHSGLYLPWPP
jgi:hypothetical protein